MNRAEHSPESGPVDALRHCWQAERARWTTVASIVLSETRLAGGSALTLVALALITLVLSLISWLLLMTLLILGLTVLGPSIAAAVGIVLGLHLLAILAAALTARRRLADLRFEHSRAALGLAGQGATVPPAATPPSVQPAEPTTEPVRHA